MEFDQYLICNDFVQTFAKCYLKKNGWFNSLDGTPRNDDGFIPFITYPAFKQIKRLINPHMRVFEYGCGASTLWWADNVAEVIAVEHNARWTQGVLKHDKPNLAIIIAEKDAEASDEHKACAQPYFDRYPDDITVNAPENENFHGINNKDYISYATALTNFPHGHFDIIVVDGMARSLCIWLAAEYLADDGFIIVDNAERWQYNRGYERLAELGYARIDYYGPGPSRLVEWCTSIFTKSLKPFTATMISDPAETDIGW